MDHSPKNPNVHGNRSTVRPKTSWLSLRTPSKKVLFLGEKEVSVGSAKKWLSFGGLCIFAAVVVVYVLVTPEAPMPNRDIPLIKPEQGPTKVRPDDPGGIQVPHQDKLIYDQLISPDPSLDEGNGQLADTDASYPPLELAAADEGTRSLHTQMQDQAYQALHPEDTSTAAGPSFDAFPKAIPPHLAARLKQSNEKLQSNKTTNKIPMVQHIVPLPAGIAHAPTRYAESPQNQGILQGTSAASSQQMVSQDTSVASPTLDNTKEKKNTSKKSETKSPKKTQATVTSGSIAKGGYRVQLASLNSQAQAETEKTRLWKRYKALLSPYSSHITRVALADKGIRYRLTTEPLPNKDSALDLCEKLKKQRTGCLIISPPR